MLVASFVAGCLASIAIVASSCFLVGNFSTALSCRFKYDRGTVRVGLCVQHPTSYRIMVET